MLKLALNANKSLRLGTNLFNSLTTTRKYAIEGLSLSVLNSLSVKGDLKKVHL